MNIVETPEEIVAQASNIVPTLKHRLALRKQKQLLKPLVIFVDELPALYSGMSEAEQKVITDAIEQVILQGPKVRMYMIIAGQGLPARLFKDSTSRNSLSAKYIFFVEFQQAQMSGLDKKEWEEKVKPLQPLLRKGVAYFKGVTLNAYDHVAIPLTTEDDLRRLLGGDDFAAVDEFEGGGIDNADPVLAVQPQPVHYDDTVKVWWEQMTEPETFEAIPKLQAYQLYVEWCQTIKQAPENSIKFARRTKELFEELQLKDQQKGPSGAQVAHYVGRRYAFA